MIADSRLALHSLRQLGFFLCVCVCVCLFVFCFLGGSLFPLIQRTLSFLFFFFLPDPELFPLGKHTHTHTHTQKEKNPHLNRWHKENWKKTTYLPILIFFSPVTGNKELGGGTGNAKGGGGRKQCPKKSQSISFCFEEMSFFPSSFALECELCACVFFLFCQILLNTNNNKIWY